MNLAIIGTAGRGPDAAALTPAHWRMMQCVAQIVTTMVAPDELVSGGAAYADHLAVQLYLDGAAPKLTLHLAAEWLGHGFKETSGDRYDAGRTSNWYHHGFSEAQGLDSLAEIGAAATKGATLCYKPGGFKARNTDVAYQMDTPLAFTFAPAGQAFPRDGGTRDTWDKWMARRATAIEHEGLQETDWPRAYHFNLTDRKLYRL